MNNSEKKILEIELEKLFVNNAKLERLSAWLSRFNPIWVMEAQSAELRHSAILGWLFDPLGTHGFGDRFLRMFLSEAMRNLKDNQELSPLLVAQADLRDARIYREWNNIDIFVRSPATGWEFIIENKFYSKQGRGQLKGYLEKVKKQSGIYKQPRVIQGIFLTLLEEEPEDSSYAPINYEAMGNLLGQLIELRRDFTAPAILQFLGHYMEILMTATGKNPDHHEFERLARELYLEHKKAIDFIVEHGVTTEFAQAVGYVFGENAQNGSKVTMGDGDEFVYLSQGANSAAFLPGDWYDALGGGKLTWEGCEKWWGGGFPVICWFYLRERQDTGRSTLALIAEVGPLSDHQLRLNLIEKIESTGCENIRFISGAKGVNTKYSRFTTKNSKLVTDVRDADEMSAKMRSLLAQFREMFESVGGVILEFVDEVTKGDRYSK